MNLRTIAVGFACAFALAACDRPAEQPETQAPPPLARSALIETMPATLSPEEAANFQVALAQLPAGATLSHAVAEGPTVALHYTAETADGPTAGVQFIIFDANHGITDNTRIDLPANPRPHLSGATVEAPAATDGQVEVDNKRVVLALLQDLTRGDVDAAANRVSDDIVEHTGTGAEGKAAWISLIRGEPARQYGVQHIAAWNDIVMTTQAVGTTTPDGLRWAPGWDIYRLRDGRIVERWRLNY